MKNTKNLNLRKPDKKDYYNVDDFNQNADILDENVSGIQTKLDTVERGAEVNVQSDWDESNSDSDAFIKNKPTNATKSKSGFMSAADKTKLDTIDEGANKTVVDNSLSDLSENPVENKAVKAAIDSKANAEHIHTPGDIVYTPRAELKCVFAIIDEAENKDHFAGWEVVDPKSLPVEILQGARKYNAEFDIGSSSTDIVVFDDGVEVVDMKSGEQPQWGEVTEDTPHITFYTYARYVRYIGEKHSYSNAERFNVNDMGFIDFIFPPGHTHDNATDKAAGFMSAADKEKLDGIDKEANKITIDDALSSVSENPVQNKVISNALSDGTVSKLGKVNVGSETQGIYLQSGTPKAGKPHLPYTIISDPVDLNSLTTTGIYILRNVITNGPSSSMLGLLFVDWLSDTPYQIFIPDYEYTTVYKRGYYRGWTDWKVMGDSVFAKKEDIKGKTHVVIATYNTQNPLKNNADYVCASTNASAVIRQALAAVQPGGKIELLDGTYNLQYENFGEGIVINKSVCIEGPASRSSSINQPKDQEGDEANPIFTIDAHNVTIKNLNLYGVANTCSSPVSIIKQNKTGAFYDNLFFTMNSPSTIRYSCIEGVSGANCTLTRIQNCRLYRGFNPSISNTDFIAFDFRNCAAFSGVIGGNISSGYGSIDVGFATQSHRQATAIYGHTAIDLYIEDTNKKETIDYKGDITTSEY